MSSPAFFRLIFALYCVEAGLFFLSAPWLPAWERLVFELPWRELRHAAASGWVRGAIAGFGLVHLLWATHDIELLLRRRGAASVAAHPETARGR